MSLHTIFTNIRLSASTTYEQNQSNIKDQNFQQKKSMITAYEQSTLRKKKTEFTKHT
jgi:hypothetical protein